MANAAINIQGDGTICGFATIHGNAETVTVRHVATGIYELQGTQGMVPAPDGWGIVTNPMDQLTAAVSLEAGTLCLETTNAANEPVDIPSRVTLHIVIDDAPTVTLPPLPEPDPAAEAINECNRLRTIATAALQLLQDTVDVGEGTADIEALILEWKRYRVALSRLTGQPGWPLNVEWPEVPQ